MTTLSGWSVGLSALAVLSIVGTVLSVGAQTNDAARMRLNATVAESALASGTAPGCTYGIRGPELFAGPIHAVQARADGPLLQCPDQKSRDAGDWLKIAGMHQANARSDLQRLQAANIRETSEYLPAVNDLRKRARLAVCVFAKAATTSADQTQQAITEYLGLAEYSGSEADAARAAAWGRIVSDIASLRKTGRTLAPEQCFSSGKPSVPAGSGIEPKSARAPAGAIQPPSPVAVKRPAP